MKRNREHSFVICCDSRSREPGSTVYMPTFQLTKPLAQISHARVKCVQFANTLFNVDENHNVFVSDVTVVVPPGFYSPQALIDLIPGATYVAETNKIQWNVTASIDLQQTSLRETLGLTSTTTGVFETQLFLASPMNVDFICPQLQSSYYTYSGRVRSENTQPLIQVPVLSGFSQMVVYNPMPQATLDMGGTTLSQLNFKVCDALDGRVLTELSHFSIQIECFTK